MAKRYYFLGIGGVSMSALAIMLKKLGHKVGGSDEKFGYSTDLLRKENIVVDHQANFQEIEKADIIVYSSAIKPENPQFQFALKNGKILVSRGELLSQVCKKYKNVIAVAGSHGKTTTTAMIYQILKEANVSPSLHLGGFRIEDGKNFVIGKNDFLVTEACEYCDNFLFLHPTISVVTNIEKEHMDYFGTFENQLKSFRKFKMQSQKVVDSVDGLSCRNVGHDKRGCLFFDVFENGKKQFHVHLKICEDVNTQNCLYAYKVAQLLGISNEVTKRALEKFAGVKTRFERVKCLYFENVVFDYAHHPTEIKNAILSAQKIYGEEKLVVIFQPHTYSRTKTLLDEFLQVFKQNEKTIIYKTYSAREKEEDGLSAKQLALLLKEEGTGVSYADDFDELKSLLDVLSYDSVLLFVGAGDLPQILHQNNFVS